MNSFSKNRTRRYQRSSLLRTQYHSAPNSRRERPTVNGGYRMCKDVIHAKSNRDRKRESAPSGITKNPLIHRAQPPVRNSLAVDPPPSSPPARDRWRGSTRVGM